MVEEKKDIIGLFVSHHLVGYILSIDTNIDLFSTITAIICSKNRGHMLRDCLRSIHEQGIFNIIIVDSNSKDDTRLIAKENGCKILNDGGRGLAFSRQMGLENATTKYIIFIDTDIRFTEPNSIRKMLTEMIDFGWDAIHAKILDSRFDKGYFESCEDFHFRRRFNKPGITTRMCCSACIIRREEALNVGFDISLKGAGEDVDFFSRFAAAKNVFGISNVSVQHLHRSGIKGFFQQRVWYGEANAALYVKSYDINLLIAPLSILCFGVVDSLSSRSLIRIPFYMLWSIALAYGISAGLRGQNRSTHGYGGYCQ